MKVIAIWLLLFCLGLLTADEIIQYNFEFPKINEAGKYNELIYEDCINLGKEGYPAIPQYAVSLLLPSGEAAREIEIINIYYYDEIRNLRLKPAGRIVPLSQMESSEYKFWESGIYDQKMKYPERKLSLPYTGFLCGHPIVSFTICPIEYIPASDEVHFIKSIEIKVKTDIDSRALEAQALLRHDEQISNRLERLIDNPDALSYYSDTDHNRPEEYDILLITNEELAAHFTEYAIFKQSCGYYIEIITVEDIYNQYTGDDNQEKIRNAIIDYYQNQNISFVILGGDSNPQNSALEIIPHRGLYATAESSIDYDIAADMYYACLDGSWNDDGDECWGESNEADLYAEVSVGRICVDSAEEIENQTHKLMMYGSSPVESSIEEFLMIGEHLWADDYGGESLNDIVTGGDINGYTTAGFTDNINVNTLYEMDYSWSDEDLFNALNAGVNMVHHLGHGREYRCFSITNDELTENSVNNDGVNTGYFTVYSQACYSGAFDNRNVVANTYHNEDCFCEKITTMQTGATSFIANSRYGWGEMGTTNGPSQYFHRQYGDAFFGEEIFLIGAANNDSKEDNAAFINENDVIRWCCYELNLFGDPTMEIHTSLLLDMEVSIPDSILTTAENINISTNVSNARVAVLQDDVLLGRGVTDENGNLDVDLEDSLISPLALNIVANAHNYNRWEGVIPVISDEPYVVYENHSITELSGNGDGLADYGETLSLNVSLYNYGLDAAQNLELELNSSDQFVEFIDNMAAVEVIEGEGFFEVIDAFSFNLAESVPDQHIIEFELTISNENNSQWNSNFQITVNAPALLISETSIEDEYAGDNDELLDPGETVDYIFSIFNCGNSLSPAVSLQLTCDNPSVIIEEDIVSLGEILPDSSASGAFTIEVGSEIEVYTPVIFTLVCDSDDYSFQQEFSHTVGVVTENFESGDFNTYNWVNYGDADWFISEDAYAGSFCARSGDISDRDVSNLDLEIDVLYDGYIRFYKKVSSIEGGSKLIFFIDNERQGRWSGEIDWSEEEFPISYGHHNITWRYGSGSPTGGEDCAWIDNILFPYPGEPSAPELVVEPASLEMECAQGEVVNSALTLSNAGDGTIRYYLHTETSSTRDVSLCYVDNCVPFYAPGQSHTWLFTIHNESNDEFIQGLDLQFPSGVTVTDAQDFVVNTHAIMYWDEETGDGVLSGWYGWNYAGGALAMNEQVSAEVNVMISEELSGPLEIEYTIYGDGCGGFYEPGIVSETLQFTSLPVWITFDKYDGSFDGNELEMLNVTFDTNELEPGMYECEIIISSSDIENDVMIPVSLNVDNSNTQENVLPTVTMLNGCYPNPFNPLTKISYQLAETSEVSLNIYNVRGQLVKTLINVSQEAGHYQEVWNGMDNHENPVASGVYFYRMKTENFNQVKKMILLK